MGYGFSIALDHIKNGGKVARRGWNGSGQEVFMYKDSFSQTSLPPFLAISTVQKTLVPWFPSQTDMLASDWELIAPEVRTPPPNSATAPPMPPRDPSKY